jgi:hypothetical protein
LQVDPRARPCDYSIQAIVSSTSTQKKKKHEIQTKEFYSLKEPRYNLRLLATVMEDVLHVYSAMMVAMMTTKPLTSSAQLAWTENPGAT